MKLFNLKQMCITIALTLCSGFALANTDDTSISNLQDFGTIFQWDASTIVKLTVIIATLAGLILVVKGLVHLKQNYTGTGQEKHLSKGIASLGFGTALLLTVPLSHALVNSFIPSSSDNNFNAGTGSINFDTTGGTNPVGPGTNPADGGGGNAT